MKHSINRRSWIKWAGALSASTALPISLLERSIDAPSPITDPSNIIKLSSNENPYGPSKKVRQTILDSMSEVCRYPTQKIKILQEAIAEKEGVQVSNVVITGGSREGLKAAGLVYGLYQGEILTCVPTYEALIDYARLFGAYINTIGLTKDFKFNLHGLRKRVSNQTKMVFVCNPNNPTGTLLDPGKLSSFCSDVSEQTLVFLDEVYSDYIEEPNYPSMVKLIGQNKNLIISRTFSKVYGLAGLRVGYLLARGDIAQRMRHRLMAGTNILGVNAALASLNDESFYRDSLAKNKEAKEMIYKTMDDLGMEYIPSHANFVFYKTQQHIESIKSLYAKEEIKVGRSFPPYEEWCRVSIGTLEEVEQFCIATKRIFG